MTTPKLKPSEIGFTDAGSINYDVNPADGSYVDIPGVATTYTSGPTSERLYLWLSFMVLGKAANVGFSYTMNVNGTTLASQFTTAINNVWTDKCRMFKATIPANTTVTIKAQAKVDSGTAVWGRDPADASFCSKIQGFAVSNA